jgi:malignant T-cell-amplified sequence
MIDVPLPTRLHLKDKEVRQLLKEFLEKYPSVTRSLKSAENFEELSVDKSSVFFVEGDPLILRTGGGLLPSLKFDELINDLPKIVVDMGAVAHVVNGAQIMRPGIKQFGNDFAKGDLVVIVDEKFDKKIALGLADMDSQAMKSLSKGRVITNLHYVGDELWKSFTA